MNPFCTTMASSGGRIGRVVVGIALGAWALMYLDGAARIIVVVIAAVPLLAGLFDFCVFAPLFGCPMSGPKIRAGR